MPEDRLDRQVQFLVEIDKLKTVFRRAYLIGDSNRRENSAEHSWHTAIMAFILDEYAPQNLDINRVIRIMLIHDIVEVDAGDISIYLRQDTAGVAEKERQAAGRIFGLLPEDQYREIKSLWDEFEEEETPEARFAAALDRLMPLIHNYYTRGKHWKEDRIIYEQVYAVIQKIALISPRLWDFAQSLLDRSVDKGYLKKV